jgi:hypothetical protein
MILMILWVFVVNDHLLIFFVKPARSLNFNMTESWVILSQAKTRVQPVCSVVIDMVKRGISSNPRQFEHPA